MLGLSDLVVLPEVQPLFGRLVADGPGLTVVAGLDPPPEPPEGDFRAAPASRPRAALPSGRPAILRLLMHQILGAQPGVKAVVVGHRGATAGGPIRVSRRLRRRVEFVEVQPDRGYAEILAVVAARRPGLVVIDQLDAGNVAAALEAGLGGTRVLSQLDTVFRGAEVADHLLALGVNDRQLGGLRWVVAVERLVTLCPECKVPWPPDAAQLEILARRMPHLVAEATGKTFWRAPGCADCRMTGRSGEVTAFDIYRHGGADMETLERWPREAAQPPLQAQGAGGGTSLVPMEAYLLGLAAGGYLPLADVLHSETDRLRRLAGRLEASERYHAETSRVLVQRQAELEAANRVLQHRTEALVALQGIGQALIRSRSLDELADQLCRRARDLGGADRVILYYYRPEAPVAEVLGVCGWDRGLLHEPVDATLLFGEERGPVRAGAEPQAQPFNHWPPGVPRRPTDITAGALRAGLRVPLVVERERLGLMIVHTSQKSRFAPGEVALLQTFANQAAVAIQRAGLVDMLQDKIVQLEAAQAELVQKERMEREMELARQVQQSVLPHVFPLVPGYAFAACNRAARQVGGDFYDVIALDAGHFGLVVGDVSDKGMPAALYMALTHSLIRAEIRSRASGWPGRAAPSPRETLLQVHRLLQELGRSQMFVTAFHGVMDGPGRRLTYARAGHDHPLLLRGDHVVTLGGEGTALGFPYLDDLNLSEEQVDLLPGDRLVLYTDGLTDLLAPDGRRLGRERFIQLLRAHAYRPQEELCQALFGDLAAFQGEAEQFDDMTILIVEVQ